MAKIPQILVSFTSVPATQQEIDALAQQMHRDFRAALKAMTKYPGFVAADCQHCNAPEIISHDHGWSGCHGKDYFLQRAKRVLLSNAKS